MLQIFVASFLLVLLGGLLCLGVATDPNAQPNPQRQRLLPIGLAMLFGGGGSLGAFWAFNYLGDAMESYLPQWLGGLPALAVYGSSTIGLGMLAFCIGRRRNRKLGY
jgi:peptidoglycan/LPS O-acetylase OafA/YrhL